MRYTMEGKYRIKMWLTDLEESAMEQARNLARLPFMYKHVAVMPDAHMGYGMPIGGVLATEGVVIPNAVGVDIGCGVVAVETGIPMPTQDDLRKVLRLIRQKVPVGFKKHKEPRSEELMPGRPRISRLPVVDRQYINAQKSLGTLGGGNHFIELQLDSKGGLWVMIHSGSRNLGRQIANHYNKVAKKTQREMAYEG